MSNVMAIARREFSERSFVLIVAVVITAAPLLALLVPRGTMQERVAAFAMLSSILAAAFTGGLSILLGVSLTGRELTEKRMSFYFSRPLSGSQIWFGKLAGAVALLFTCGTITFLPALFYYPRVSASWSRLAVVIPYFAAAALALLFAGHTLSTIFRSRSRWLILDLVAAIAFVVALRAVLTPLVTHGATMLSVGIVHFTVLAFIVAVAIGGAWQLSRGRVDARRNHRELSRFLWASMAVVLAIVFAFTRWVVAAGPHDITCRWVERAPAGSWIFASGFTKHRYDFTKSFLYDVSSGAFIETNALGTVDFNRSGSAAAWLEPEVHSFLPGLFRGAARPTWEVVATRLAPGAKPVRTGIFIDFNWAILDVTPDVSRVLVNHDSLVTVYDIGARKSLGTVLATATDAHFISPDVVRLSSHKREHGTTWTVSIREYDLRRRAMTTRFESTATGDSAFAFVARDDRTIIVRTNNAGVLKFRLYDLASGAELPVPPMSEKSALQILPDGRRVIADRGSLSVYRDTTLVSRFDLPGAPAPVVHFELEPGKWIIGDAGPARMSMLVDLDRGVILKKAPGLMPLELQQGGTLLFVDEKGEVVTWDRKPIL